MLMRGLRHPRRVVCADHRPRLPAACARQSYRWV